MNLKKLLLASVAMVALSPGAWAEEELASITDGNYFIYSTATKTFLSRGNTWGTRAAVDPAGLPFKITTTDGVSIINYPSVDGTSLFASSSEDLYVNWSSDKGTTNEMTIYKVDGGYKIKNNNYGSYIKFDGTNAVHDNNGEVLQILTGAQHQQIQESNHLASINNVLQQISISEINNEDELASTLDKAQYVAIDKTSSVTNPKFANGTTNWSLGTSGTGDNGALKSGSITVEDQVLELYQGYGTIQHDAITVEQGGLYKISFQGFQRHTTAATCLTYGKEGIAYGNAYVTVNGTSTTLPDWYSDRTGDNAPGGRAAARTLFDAGKYSNDIYVYVSDESKTINFSIVVPVGSTQQARWIALGGIQLTFYISLEQAKNKYETTLKEANNIVNSTMYKDVQAKLKSLISKTVSENTQDYLDATDELQKAIDEANSSITEYAGITKYEYIATVQAKADNLDDAGKDAFTKNIEAVKTSVTNCEYENTTAYEKAVDAAYVSAVKSQNVGADMTGALSNPDFSTTDLSGWTITGTNPKAIDTSNKDCEYFEQTFDMSQTLTGMKKGTYEISFQAFQRPGTANQTLYDNYASGSWTSVATLYTTAESKDVKHICEDAQEENLFSSDYKSVTSTDSKTLYIPNSMAGARAYFDKDLYKVTATAVVATEGGDLTFGFKGSLPKNGWLIFANFALKYTDTKATVAAEESEALLKTVPTTDVYNKEIKENVDKWAEQLTADKTDAEAYVNLMTAIKTAETSISTYASVASILEQVKDIVESSNFYSADALEKYYTTPKANYEARTMTDEEATAYAVSGKAGTAAKLMMSLWDEEPANDASYYTNTWSTEGDDDDSKFAIPFYEYYVDNKNSLGTKTLTGTYTTSDLDADTYYRVKARVRVRVKDFDTNAPYGIKLQVNDGEAVDVSLGTKYPKKGDFYIETVAANAKPVDGKLVVKFIVAEDNNISWLSFRDVNIEESSLASTTDATTLKESIEEAKKALAGYTLGFEEGECAPYKVTLSTIQLKRIENIVNLEATAIDQLTYKSVKAKYDAVDWAPNRESVNAIYDGTFANAKNNGAPLGWISTHGDGLGTDTHPRAFVGDSRLSEFNETNSAFFLRFDGTCSDPGTMYYYGKTDGYKLPLKANTVYYVKVDYKGWGSTGLPLRLNTIGDYYYVGNTNDNADTDDNETQRFYIIFKTEDAADYTISFQNHGASKKQNAIVSNIELKRIPVETRKTAKNKFGTVCLPYPFSADGAQLYTVESTENNVVTLTEATAGEAGVAYIYQATAEEQSFTVADGSVLSNPSTTDKYLTGVFESTTATAGTYVLQTQGDEQAFYKVAEGSEPTIGAYRAYLTVPTTDASASAALRISFDNETTGIEAVKALTDGKAEIYDLNGRKLNKLRKGINIVDGVKVIVK
jgi:hypothetical protein